MWGKVSVVPQCGCVCMSDFFTMRDFQKLDLLVLQVAVYTGDSLLGLQTNHSALDRGRLQIRSL